MKAEREKLFTINGLADLTGIDRMTVRRRLADTKPAKQKGKVKMFRAEQALAVLKSQKPAGERNDNGDLERKKLERQIENLDIDIAAKKSDLMPTAEVRRDVTRYALENRSKLLSLGARMAQTLAVVTDPLIVQEKIDAEVRSILNHLAKGQWTGCICENCGKEIKP